MRCEIEPTRSNVTEIDMRAFPRWADGRVTLVSVLALTCTAACTHQAGKIGAPLPEDAGGVISYRIESPTGHITTLRYAVRGVDRRYDTDLGILGAVGKMTSIFDGRRHTLIFYTAAARFYIETEAGGTWGAARPGAAPDTPALLSDSVRLVRSGTSETVAGVACADYVATKHDWVVEYCMAIGMENFRLAESGMGAAGVPMSAGFVAQVIADVGPGAFPLRTVVRGPAGTQTTTATLVSMTAPDPSEFGAPSGYTLMQLPWLGGANMFKGEFLQPNPSIPPSSPPR
jgi:hypothetical protein